MDFAAPKRYGKSMEIGVDPAKLTGSGASPERGYDAWKREKIERGVAQAKDRAAMIPADQLLRDLGI